MEKKVEGKKPLNISNVANSSNLPDANDSPVPKWVIVVIVLIALIFIGVYSGWFSTVAKTACKESSILCVLTPNDSTNMRVSSTIPNVVDAVGILLSSITCDEYMVPWALVESPSGKLGVRKSYFERHVDLSPGGTNTLRIKRVGNIILVDKRTIEGDSLSTEDYEDFVPVIVVDSLSSCYEE